MSLNLVTLVGRAGMDPEVRYFESGKVVCTFSLAVNRFRKGEDKPDWFNLELWGAPLKWPENMCVKAASSG